MGNIFGRSVDEKDIIVLVMGPPGAGKSSFIKMATGAPIVVGHALEICTTEVTPVRTPYLDGVIFVDTPGFDDTNRSDADILDATRRWLKTNYDDKSMLAGILYLHRISDNRMAGLPLANLRIFKKLCGNNALQNIILTTTMWDAVTDVSTALRRERELESEYWNGMIIGGSTTARYKNTPASAWDTASRVIQNAYKQRSVKLQEELLNIKRHLPDTNAGLDLYVTLENLVHKRQETLQQIQDELKLRGHSESGALDTLVAERADLRKQLERTIDEMKSLKLLEKRPLRVLKLWG